MKQTLRKHVENIQISKQKVILSKKLEILKKDLNNESEY